MKIRNSTFGSKVNSRQAALQNAISNIAKKKVHFETSKVSVALPDSKSFLSPNMISGKNSKVYSQWNEYSGDQEIVLNKYPPNSSSRKQR